MKAEPDPTTLLCHVPHSQVSYIISRHTVVCRAAQEAGAPHREYIDRKNENVIFTPCISVITYRIGTKFATQLPASQGSLHSKFE